MAKNETEKFKLLQTLIVVLQIIVMIHSIIISLQTSKKTSKMAIIVAVYEVELNWKNCELDHYLS